MKRKQFLSATLATALFPLVGQSYKILNKKGGGKGFKIRKGEGRLHGHITLKGVNVNVLDIKVSGTDTNGGIAVFEQTSISPGRGTPLHLHPEQNEMFYVLEGQYYFQVGDDSYHLSGGDSIFLPMNIPHAWTQESAQGKMIVVFQPAGQMENFFLALAELNHIPDQDELSAIFASHGMQIVGPPLKLE